MTLLAACNFNASDGTDITNVVMQAGAPFEEWNGSYSTLANKAVSQSGVDGNCAPTNCTESDGTLTLTITIPASNAFYASGALIRGTTALNGLILVVEEDGDGVGKFGLMRLSGGARTDVAAFTTVGGTFRGNSPTFTVVMKGSNFTISEDVYATTINLNSTYSSAGTYHGLFDYTVGLYKDNPKSQFNFYGAATAPTLPSGGTLTNGGQTIVFPVNANGAAISNTEANQIALAGAFAVTGAPSVSITGVHNGTGLGLGTATLIGSIPPGVTGTISFEADTFTNSAGSSAAANDLEVVNGNTTPENITSAVRFRPKSPVVSFNSEGTSVGCFLSESTTMFVICNGSPGTLDDLKPGDTLSVGFYAPDGVTVMAQTDDWTVTRRFFQRLWKLATGWMRSRPYI